MKSKLTIATMVVLATFSLNAMACGNDAASSGDGKSVSSPASESKTPKSFNKAPKVGTRAYCPVMKAEFTVSENSPRSEYKGKHYVFCCPGCKPKFDADPEKYI